MVEHDSARVDRWLASDDLVHRGLLTFGVVVDDDELGYAVPLIEFVGVAGPGHGGASHLSDQGAYVARGCGTHADAQGDEPPVVNVDGGEDDRGDKDAERAQNGDRGRGGVDLDELPWSTDSARPVDRHRPTGLGSSGLCRVVQTEAAGHLANECAELMPCELLREVGAHQAAPDPREQLALTLAGPPLLSVHFGPDDLENQRIMVV